MATLTAVQSNASLYKEKLSSFELHPTEFDSNPIVSFFLDGLIKDVKDAMDSMIQKAENGVLEIEMEAGRQLTEKKTIQDVDKVIKDKLLELEGMVQVFQARNQDLLKKMTSVVTQFLLTLPFANIQPQLREAFPKAIVRGAYYTAVKAKLNPKSEVDVVTPSKSDSKSEVSDDVFLEFAGVFPFSSDPKFPPVFKINNKAFTLVDNTTQKLTFKGSAKDIFPDQTIPDDRFAYAVGELQIPWDNTSNLSILWRALGYTDYRTYVYKDLVISLPASPGKLTAIYSDTKQGQPEVKKYIGMQINEDASHAYHKGHCAEDDIHKFSFSPETGFDFVVGTQGLSVAPGAHGRHYEKITNVTPDKIDVEIGMDRCSGKHMGIISFHVEAQQIKPTYNQVVRQEPVELKWGMQKVVPLQNDGNLVKLLYKAFDSADIYEFGPDTNLDNRYVKVIKKGDNLEITAIPPDDIAALKV